MKYEAEVERAREIGIEKSTHDWKPMEHLLDYIIKTSSDVRATQAKAMRAY